MFGVVALWHLLRDSPQLRLTAIGLVLVSPFAWYYLNEVRPYAMQLGASCAVFGCAARVIWGGRALVTSDLVIASLGLIAMAGASLLSVPWVGMFLLVVVWAMVRGKVVAPKAVLIGVALVNLVALGWLGIYYAGTLSAGARAATAGGGLIQGLGFSGYELLGFSGLGPGRTELRQTGLSVFTAAQLAAIAALAITYGAIVIAFLLGKPKFDRWRWQIGSTLILIAVPLAFFVLLGVVKDFRVLGRHLTPVLPAIALVVAGLLAQIRPARVRVAASAGLFALLLASSLSLRLAERHRRDDYRQASQLVREEFAKRRDVLWVANLAGLPFYGPDDVPRRALGDLAGMHIYRFGSGDPSFLPHTVILSKPEIHDPKAYARNLLKEGHYRLDRTFPGFQVWVR